MSNPRHASGMNIFPLVLLFLSISFLESVFGSSSGRSVLFMQGDSQALAPNTLWSMDLNTHSAHKLGTSTKMFTSHGVARVPAAVLLLLHGSQRTIFWEASLSAVPLMYFGPARRAVRWEIPLYLLGAA